MPTILDIVPALLVVPGNLTIIGALIPPSLVNALNMRLGWALIIGLPVQMIVQAFIYPNEHVHLWTDIPAFFVLAGACWYWHPRRVLA